MHNSQTLRERRERLRDMMPARMIFAARKAPLALISSGAILVFAASSAVAQAANELVARSPSVRHIQSAIDGLGGPGVVRVPPGQEEAVGTALVPGGVSVIGAGSDKTQLFRAGRSDPATTAPIFRIDGDNGLPSRISGFEITGFTDPENAAWDNGIYVSDAVDFRIDNCKISRFGFSGVYVRGEARGVVDNCIFVDNFKSPIGNVGYGVVVFGPGDWRDKAESGGPNAVFIEDCEFRGQRHAVASNNGARYVFRHNRITGNDNSHAIDAHGQGYGSERGTQWIEVYNNFVEKPVGGTVAMVFRGGGGVVFGNTIRDYQEGIRLTLDFDERLDWNQPYPITDQIGGMWLWLNTLDGEPASPGVPNRSAGHIKMNRDFFLEPKPGYRPFAYPHPLAAGELPRRRCPQE